MKKDLNIPKPVSQLRCFFVVVILSLPGILMPKTASAFTNSICGFADPFITYVDGRYYLMGTDSGYMRVISSATLEGLNSGSVVKVYNTGVFYESPELYWMGPPYNHWYIYYTQSPNKVIAIESDTSDPQGTYHYKATLTTNTYDVTVIKIGGKLYLFGSTYSHIVVQSMSNPYATDSSQVNIAGLTQSWESSVIEAPDGVFSPSGTLFLFYSSGIYNNEGYAEGALKFNGGSPLVETNWTKLTGPLFKGTGNNGNFATATCSPFKSPDGSQDWFVYGGYPTPGFVKRNTRVQKMSWNGDGTPNLGTPIPLGQTINEPPVPYRDSATKKFGHGN